jgi:hypothetical protein
VNLLTLPLSTALAFFAVQVLCQCLFLFKPFKNASNVASGKARMLAFWVQKKYD